MGTKYQWATKEWDCVGRHFFVACGLSLILLMMRQPASSKGRKERNNARLIERLKLLLNIFLNKYNRLARVYTTRFHVGPRVLVLPGHACISWHARNCRLTRRWKEKLSQPTAIFFVHLIALKRLKCKLNFLSWHVTYSNEGGEGRGGGTPH